MLIDEAGLGTGAAKRPPGHEQLADLSVELFPGALLDQTGRGFQFPERGGGRSTGFER